MTLRMSTSSTVGPRYFSCLTLLVLGLTSIFVSSHDSQLVSTWPIDSLNEFILKVTTIEDTSIPQYQVRAKQTYSGNKIKV